MKKPTIFKALIAVVFLLLSISSRAQLRQGFAPRYTTSLNGDILVIGNNSLNRDNGRGERPRNAYDDQGSSSQVNDNFDMKNIDIDSETSFNSSSATLTIPQASQSCYEIVYAALYWSGTYQGTDRSKINQVRLKTPTTTTYKALTGSILWDEGGTGVTSPYGSLPYACFVDITAEVKAAKEGVYTVADVMASEGKFSPGGNSAGWSIFVIYKDPLLPSKYITSFDGFSIIRSSDGPLDIPISGFRTNPFGDVNVKLAFSALEGDNQLSGDGLQIIGGKPLSVWGPISSLVRPIAAGPPVKPNFFNSTITDGDIIMGGRTPNSKNTLGYDAGVVTLDNNVGGVQNSVMQNDETNATLRINTTQDSYFMFFNALSVEIIAPKIVLRKNVLDKDDNNINAQTVTLDQELRYEIKFKNEGNDNAKNLTITDVLPNNVIFNGLSDILVMDSRITAAYTPATRTLVFTVPDALVVAKGAEFTLKFKVRVVKDCNELVDACSNEIKNTAVSKYFGDKNTTPGGFGEGSFSTISQCNVGEPTSTNFLVGIDKCLFSRDVSLCGTAVLKAANGYSTYIWKDPNGVIFGGNNQSVTVDKPGIYTVDDSGAVNCKPIQQKFVVTDYLASANKNPIKGDNIDPATGLAYGCVRDLKPFPKIFLCGLNDKRVIDTQITGATSITWQETKDVPPAGSPVPDSCPNEGATNWTTVANGPIYTADRPGVFRLVVNYGNNTCVVTYYFNVYQNLLDATVKKQDIVCNTKGSITVTNPLPNTGYVYSLDGTNYQASNIFNNVAKGSYTVLIKQTVLQTGQISACTFKVDVNVEQLDFTTNLVATHPLCNGEHGTIKATINNVPGQYQFILRKKGSTVDIQNSGLIDNNIITFNGVDPGVYEVLMSTANNGCSVTKEIEVFDYRLTAVAKVTKALSACGDGEITVTVTGGTPRPGPPPYYLYYVNGSTTFVTNPVIPVTSPLPASGEYNIVVVDANNCTVTIPPVKVTDLPKPTITATPNSVDCYGVKSGQIDITVTPANSGYAVSYSVDNGAFSSVTPITNLAAGTHSLVVKYTYNGIECTDPARTITIAGPTDALTASAGVSELAGCGPAGFEHQGKIRITNVQGGTPGYTYSFDGQGTWIASNEAYVNPGKYTVYVKDSKGCIYAMSDIVLDPKPTDPTIEPNPQVVYNCDGTGIATVVVNNTGGGNYTYEYYIDTKPNTPITSNVFNNVPTGTHQISVKYKAVAAATYSNLLQEDFGKGGYTTTPGISPKYCFEDETTPHSASFPTICGNINDYQINDGKYAVASSIKTTFGGTWIVAKDHTTPVDNLGRFLCVNIGSSAGVGGIIYSKPIKDVIVDQPVIISLWAENLMKSTTGSNYYDPELTIQLINNLNGVGGTETIVATTDTANPWKVPRNEIWNYKELSLNPGAYNNLSFVIRSYNNKFSGNDLLVDDIWVRQLPKSCITEKKFDVIIQTNKAFKVSEPIIDDATCSDKSDGRITIAVDNFDATNGFKYSIDNGQNWSTSTTSPVIISGLTKGTYKVIVKNDDAGLCSSSFDKEIKAPLAITLVASVFTPPTCTVGAVIKATASNGTPNYKYELRLTDGTIVKAFQDSNTFQLNVGQVGDFVVFVKDASNCASPASNTVNVTGAVAPTASLDVTASDLCYDSVNKATLVVTVNNGKSPFSYSLDGQAGQTGNTFTNVGTGLHTIVVTDSNGCTATVSGIPTIADELKAEAKLTKTIDCTTSPKAQITIMNIQGGTPGYTYEVSTNGGTLFTPMLTAVYDTDIAGSYIFRVTDSKGCKFTTPAVLVNAKVDPTASLVSKTDPKCYKDANGQFTVLAEGGAGPAYTYSFDGGGFGNSATYSGLDAFVGSVNSREYTYQVKDSKGCVSPIYKVTLNNPTEVVASANFAANTTCSTTTTITTSAIGGTGSYKYNFGVGNTNYNDTNTLVVTNTNAVQTITYSVRDTNGCIDTNTIDVPAFNPPTKIAFSTPAAITCNDTKTSITLTVTGGIAPLTYTITSGPVTGSNTTGTFNNLTAGTYTFRVTDATGCSTTDSTVINPAATIAAAASKTDELCFGSNNGTATFTVGTSNFNYTITPVSGTANKVANVVTVTGLAPGTYTFVATDISTGCSSTPVDAVIGTATAINYTVTASKINCSTTISTLTITGISGGSGGYTYAYAASPSTVPTTGYGTTLKVDTAALTTTIDVYVKDTNGCVVKKTVSVLTEDAPHIDTPATQCYTGAPVNILITGTYVGTPSYSINGTNYVPTNNFSLTPGSYTLYLKDGFGCPATTTYVVPEQLTIKTEVETDVACTANTTIKLSSTGGTGAVTYQVSYNGGGYTNSTNPYVATATGTYQFRVTDSKAPAPACSALSSVINVTLKSTVLTVSTSKVDVKCHGESIGSLLVTPTSGKTPYTYSITKGGVAVSTTVSATTATASATGLAAGIYDIVVTDAIGCQGTAQVTITEPALLEANANVDPFTCNTSNTKESKDVTVTAIGGKGPYTYSFNGGSYGTSNTLTVSDNGNTQTVKYSVKDDNGCTTAEQTITVSPLILPKISKVDATVIYCDPLANRTSTATITLSSGSGTYTIVSGPVINTSGATNGSFTGLTAGNYVFRVTNANGCYNDFSKNIPALVSIDVTATKLNDVYCHGDATGTIRFNVSNFTSTYSYKVNSEPIVTGRNETVFTLNRGVGIYNVVFTDETTNCVLTRSVQILEPVNALGLAIDSNVNANCGKITSTVTVHATGGTPTYQYAILDADDTTSTPIYGPGAVFNINSNSGADLNWVIYARDNNGCITSKPVTIATDTKPTVSAVVSNQCTASGSSFTIVATGANGVAPYTYTINTGVAPSPADTFTVAAGTYTITVKDANGCTNTTSVTVSGTMIPTAVRTKDLTCAAVSPTDATINVSVVGGKPAFGYRVKMLPGAYTGTPIPFAGVSTSFVYTTGTAGTYQFEITDANGCTKETSTVVINPTPTVTASSTPTNPTCNAGVDGVVRLNALTGEAPFKYSFNGLAFDDAYVFGGLAAGTYNYIVRDVKGCEYANTVVLTNPAPIVGIVTQTPIICNLNTLGTFSVNVDSGGSAPYVYTLYDTNHAQLATYTENSATLPTTPYTFSGLDFGYYYITIVDANGCKFETPRLRIETPPYLKVTSTVDSNSCATGVDILVTTSGGTGPYKYSIFGQTETAAIASNSYLFKGLLHNTTYFLQVRDVNNCISIVEVPTPPAPSAIKITGTASTNATCAGDSNGTLKFTVQNYNAAVTQINYRILNALTLLPVSPPIGGPLTGPAGGPVTHTIPNLPAGNYVLQVTEDDQTQCSTAYTFEITQPAQPLKSNITSVIPANCHNGAFVTIKTTGGTGPYYYGVAVAPAIPTVFTSTNNVLELDPSLGTNWNIVVRDSQGCEVPLGQVIPVDSSPVIALDLLNDCAAEGAFTVEVSATTSGTGAYSISVDSDNSYVSIPGGLPHNVTNLSSGSHTIYIKDVNGCVDFKTININAPLNLLPAVINTDPTCLAINGGKITLTTTGGAGTYTYTIDAPGAVVTNNVITNIAAGNYTVTVTDGVCSATVPVELALPIPVTFDAVVVDATCFNSNTGTITVNLLPGNTEPVYTYAIASATATPLPGGIVLVGNVFTNVPQGSYEITVTSGKGCPLTKIFDVGQPTAAVGAIVTVDPFSCNTSNSVKEAVVTVVGTGGTGLYQYNFDGGAVYYDDNTKLVDNIAGETVHYYVKDSKGCMYDDTVNVAPYQKLTSINFSIVTAPVCPTNVADVKVIVAGGYTPYAKYEIISPTYVNNLAVDTFTNLDTNVNYLFRVTDANGCYIEDTFKVSPVVPINISRTSFTNVSCNTANGTDNNGTATFTVSDFSSTGNYTIGVTSTPAGLAYNAPTVVSDVITVTGLVEGTYTISVTDKTTNCSKSADVIITMPAPMVIAATATKVFCNSPDSEIKVTSVTGGTSPYTYAVVKGLDPAPTTFTDNINTPFTAHTGLVDLSWDVYVKDANGCIAGPQNVLVTYNLPPVLNMPAQQCFVGAELTVDLDALSTTYNGVKSFTVNGLPVSSLAKFTADGSYILTVIDDNGCKDSKTFVIQKQLTASATLKKDLYCTGATAATIDVVIIGGVTPYSYQMYFNGVATGALTTTPGDFTVSPTADGDYYFVITDSNTPACSVTTNTEKVTVPEQPEGTEAHVDLKCMSDTDGSLTITPSKGVGPYTFALTPAGNNTGNTSGTYTGLTAGNYSVIVTDSKGCSSLAIPVVLTEPAELKATHAILPNTSCSTKTVIEVTAQDGTPGYTYNFNNRGFDGDNTFTVIDNEDGTPQTVTYVVRDANGCEFTSPVAIPIIPLNKPSDLSFTATAITCATGNSSNVSVTATNGVGQLTFEITEFNGAAPAVPYAPVTVANNTIPAVFNGLPFGDYMFRVTDNNKCSYDELLPIKDVVKIEVTNTLLTDMSCNTTNDGKITFAISKFAGTYTYTITKDGAPFVASTTTSDVEIPLTGLAFGTYKISIVDDITTCPTDYSVIVKQPSVVIVTEIDKIPANCIKGALVTVQGGGGSPDYTYSFVTAGDPAGAFDAASIRELDPATPSWFVYAKDQNGCISAPITVNITTDPLPAGFTASATSQCADIDGNYEIVVNDALATGMAPFTYSIGGDFQTGKTFTVNVPGKYDLTVKDKFGCTFEFTALVEILEPLDLKYNNVVLPTCADGDGSLSASATGGSGNYSYTIGTTTITTTPANFTLLSAGKHTIVVTDLTTGCPAKVDVTLGAATPIIGFDATSTPVTCFGSTDGTITAVIDQTGANNNPTYMYSLNGGTPQVNPYFTGLAAGDYTVEVVSGRGCPDSMLVKVETPAIIAVPAPAVLEYGCTNENNSNYATITVNGVTGGSGNYTYDFIKNGVVKYSGPRNVFTEMDYTGGTYTIIVKDDKGCIGNTQTAPVKAFIAMDKVVINVDTKITCINKESISAAVKDKNGVDVPGIFDYTINGTNGTVYGPITNNDGKFAGLDVGNYIISVLNTDTKCIIEAVHFIFEPNVFVLKAVPTSDKICYGTTAGVVNLTLLDNLGNPAGPFTYTITGPYPSTAVRTGDGPNTEINLVAGQYSVTAKLKNSPECTTAAVIFTIEQPTAELVVTKTQSEITCATGNNDGVIIANATGGWPGEYLYELRSAGITVKPYNSSPIFDNLTAGDYTVFVKDGLGCEASVGAKLVNPTPIQIQISATPMLTCFDNDNGVVTINSITGGSGNYTYTLNGVLADGTVTVEESQGIINQFTGLKAGTYTVTVKDTWTCTSVSNTVVIGQPTEVKPSLAIARNETCQLVPILKLTVTGGNAPYYYSEDGTNYSASFNGSIDITLPKTTVSKDYQYFVKDQNGCVSTVSNIVNVPVVPKLDFTSVVGVDIKCKGSAEGTITVVATGGLGNYVYTLQNAAGVNITPAPTQVTPGVFTELPVGKYIVKLESSDCSVNSVMVEIKEPNIALSAEAIPTDVTCNGFNNGKITVNAAGGTGVYKYAIEPEFRQFFDKNVFENLKPGFYDVLVQDENECYIFIKDVEVKEPNPLTGALVDGSLFQETCAGEKDGAFSIIVSGGTAEYSVSLDAENGPFTQGTAGQTRFDFDNLSGGPHIVYFVDASGCNGQVDIAMDAAVTLNPTNEVNYDCVNNAASNMVTVDPGYDGDHSEIDYSLDGGQWQMNNIFTGLTPGNHVIKVRHTNGCSADTSFIIKTVDPLVLTLSEEKGVWNVITATATGGSGDYEYSIDGINFSSENKFKIYKTDTYTIIVRDKNGCTDTKSIPVKYIDVCLDNYFTPSGATNTTWGPGCTNIYDKLEFSIFDRYGRVIAKYHYGQKWDGRYNGAELPSGDYWYVLKLNDEKDDREFVGHFTLYR
ncbi:T9SS type B sorting domain-containing protein [Flavobacterium sp. JAS]|uniref:T9SS type B sorting domain-containing protein n=1 Tax=Flavobacterium sp. JAS TaxID=2897329 RepID=UPI001E50707F|nr:T9SS type B sorting domain-containing protein [Flavobacterium sp. JAS]MCD0469377.1 T9SS type B sorting domain-containing protein [Flavobacterium sp. JAS]